MKLQEVVFFIRRGSSWKLIYVIYSINQYVPHRKHCISIANANRLMLLAKESLFIVRIIGNIIHVRTTTDGVGIGDWMY
jgi:hypothetical protein